MFIKYFYLNLFPHDKCPINTPQMRHFSIPSVSKMQRCPLWGNCRLRMQWRGTVGGGNGVVSAALGGRQWLG